MDANHIPQAVHQFEALPDSALLTINACGVLLSWSRSTINRAFASGRLTKIKLGHSTRIRVGEVRALLAGGAA